VTIADRNHLGALTSWGRRRTHRWAEEVPNRPTGPSAASDETRRPNADTGLFLRPNYLGWRVRHGRAPRTEHISAALQCEKVVQNRRSVPTFGGAVDPGELAPTPTYAPRVALCAPHISRVFRDHAAPPPTAPSVGGHFAAPYLLSRQIHPCPVTYETVQDYRWPADVGSGFALITFTDGRVSAKTESGP
jgi:hypothetical protein